MFVQNHFMGPIEVTEEQFNKAFELHKRFGGSVSEWRNRHFWTEGSMVISEFGNMTIGILPDGSSHS